MNEWEEAYVGGRWRQGDLETCQCHAMHMRGLRNIDGPGNGPTCVGMHIVHKTVSSAWVEMMSLDAVAGERIEAGGYLFIPTSEVSRMRHGGQLKRGGGRTCRAGLDLYA